MIPVYQTFTVANDGCGNCFNACVASIMEMPLREVAQVLPNFKGDYWGEWDKWGFIHGIRIDHRGPKQVPKGFAIASGHGGRTYPEGHEKAGNPIMHAVVVFNGETIHDPFPGGKGIEKPEWFWVIEPLTDVDKAYPPHVLDVGDEGVAA